MRRQDEKPRYLSYILRLWETIDGERRMWRASLAHPGNDDWQGFSDIEELFRFLRSQVEETPDAET